LAEPLTRIESDLDALLPQTQCTRCGYPGCRPYAQAMARGEAGINRCPPGGASTIAALAARLGVAPRGLDPACGIEGPPRVAVIDAERCIGCALCLPACPVDAIVGAKKYLHEVLPGHCTGCELCVAPCPVDCIRLEPLDAAAPGRAPPTAELNRRRYQAQLERRERRAAELATRLTAAKRAAQAPQEPGP
jgi:electron transport complex protein RnfB